MQPEGFRLRFRISLVRGSACSGRSAAPGRQWPAYRLHEDRNVSVVAVMGELGVIAEADSVFLSSDSRRCPIPGEVELIALYGDADALQIIQIRKAQAVRLGRDEHFDIALDGIVVGLANRLSNVSFSAPTRKSMPSPPLAWAMPWL